MGSRTTPGTRGVSELVGIVLLIGIVMAGVALIVVSNYQATQSTIDEIRGETSQQAILEFDSRMETVVEKDREGVAEFDMKNHDDAAGTMTTVTGDELSITLEGKTGTCSTTVSLDALRYSVPDGPAYTYQAGAIWKTTESGRTTVSQPAVEYEDGNVDFELVDVVNDQAGDGDFTVRERESASVTATQDRREELLADPACRRPNEVTFTVASDRFHARWFEYLKEEMPDTADVSHTPSADRVTVILDKQELPDRVDDSKNAVVDFTTDDAMGKIGDPDSDGNPEPIVPKGSSVTFDSSAHLLASQVGKNQTPDGITKMKPRPGKGQDADVMHVVDTSGSMSDEVTLALLDVEERKVARWSAACGAGKSFDADLETGMVLFDDGPYYEQGLTDDEDDISDAIDASMETSSKTVYNSALEAAKDELQNNGNDSRRNEIVLYTDGNGCDYTCRNELLAFAKATRKANVTLHVIGVGKSPNRDFLRNVTNRSGGYYGEYRNVKTFIEYCGFYERRILKRYVDSRTVDRRILQNPVQLKLSVGGKTYTPWNESGPGAPPVSNPIAHSINYPPPTQRTDGYVIPGGEGIDMKLKVWNCDDYEQSGHLRGAPWNQAELYFLMRCADLGSVAYTSGSPNLYVDGDPIPTDGKTVWWQDRLPELLPPRTVEDTDGDGNPDEFDLKSDQIVVVFEMTDVHGKKDYNNVAFLLEVGDARTQAPGDWVINLDVSKVTVENE